MPKRTRAETVEYVAKLLKSKAEMAYADVVKTAKSAGHHVYPLIMGLAKNKLGLGRKKKRGRPAGKRGRPVGRPAGRPRGRPPGGGGGFTGELVRSITRMQNDIAGMRGALREIAKTAGRF